MGRGRERVYEELTRMSVVTSVYSSEAAMMLNTVATASCSIHVINSND
jgi:hypothetical protein